MGVKAVRPWTSSCLAALGLLVATPVHAHASALGQGVNEGAPPLEALPPLEPPPLPAAAIVPPSVVDEARPLYPRDAFLEGVRGDVVMDIDIDAVGLVQRVAVKASPDPRLTWAALGAAAEMTFVPALQDDQPIAVRVAFTLSFTIDDVERERALAEEEARALALRAETAPVNLRGRVLVGGERARVAGAFVSVEGTELEAVTDGDGAFALRGVPEGRQTLRVQASGFLPGVVTEDFKLNELTEVNLFVVPRPGAQSETVITERRTQREVTRRVLTQKELTRVPGTFGDAIRVVQRLPGVARAPFGLGAVLVRGGSPEDSNILIDGHLSRVLFHLGAGPSVLNTDFVERLELYPGGQGARFGRAIAGTIDVVTRDPRTDTWSGRATVDLLQTGFRLEGPLPLPFLGEDPDAGRPAKLGFFVAGRTSYVAEVLNLGDTIGRVVDLPLNGLTLAPRYSDYQAKLVWKLPGRNTLSLAWLGSNDVLDLAFDPSNLGPNAPSSVGITVAFHRINPVWRMTSAAHNSDGTPKLRVWVSPALEVNSTENRFDASQFQLSIERASLRAEVEIRPTAGVGLLLGTDDTSGIFRSVADLPLLLPDERLFPRPATSDPPRSLIEDTVYGNAWGLYAEADLRLGPLLVVAGGRADLWTYYDQVRTSLDPRFTARLDVLRDVTLKGNVGLYHQVASPFELAQKFGNPKLPVERGWQVGAGVEVQLTRSLELDAQLFGRTADALAELVVAPTAFFASGAARIQPIGEQRVVGAELLLRQRLDAVAGAGRLFGWIAYTLMRAEERTGAPVGVVGARASRWLPSAFDQTHILSVATSWETPSLPVVGGLEVGAAFRYVTGNPTTFAIGGQFDADTSRYQRFNGPRLASRLPPFVQLDLRVDKRWVFDTWALGAFLDLQNATNQQNYEFFQYAYDFSAVQGFPGLPILPVFGIDASF